jgi:type IV secretion system protein VirB2
MQKKYFFSLLCLSLILPLDTFASSGHITITSILDKLVGILQGDIAKCVGLIAVVGSGYLCIFKQQFPKEQFLLTLVGLGVVFGSSSIYSSLVG